MNEQSRLESEEDEDVFRVDEGLLRPGVSLALHVTRTFNDDGVIAWWEIGEGTWLAAVDAAAA